MCNYHLHLEGAWLGVETDHTTEHITAIPTEVSSGSVGVCTFLLVQLNLAVTFR